MLSLPQRCACCRALVQTSSGLPPNLQRPARANVHATLAAIPPELHSLAAAAHTSSQVMCLPYHLDERVYKAPDADGLGPGLALRVRVPGQPFAPSARDAGTLTIQELPTLLGACRDSKITIAAVRLQLVCEAGALAAADTAVDGGHDAGVLASFASAV